MQIEDFIPDMITIVGTCIGATEQIYENSAKRSGTFPSLDFLHFHRQKQLFPFAYVDDIKIAGRKARVVPMPLIDEVC